MKRLKKALKDIPLVYVTRDIDRARCIPLDTPGYHSISNSPPPAKGELPARNASRLAMAGGEGVSAPAKTHAARTNIVLIDAQEPLDTRDILRHPTAVAYIDDLKRAFGGVHVLVFKSSGQIERICDEHDWTLLNPAATHANTVEEKMSQVDWLDTLSSLLPSHRITTCKEMTLEGAPYIAQFNRAHTGEGTLLIENQKQIDELQAKHPNRDVRITEYVQGPMFTSNNVVTDDGALMGNISYQITGLAPYTDNQFATIGNDWGIPATLLNDAQRKVFRCMVDKIGAKLQEEGWRGLFGIDVVMDEKTGKIYLIEINARQPQSATYESTLQRAADAKGLTTCTAHIMALLGLKIDKPLTTIDDGAQLIDRRSNTWHRFQNSIMEDHNKPNKQLTSDVRSLPVRQAGPTSEDEWQTLSPAATKVVDNYLNLPIAGKSVQCPYVNNRRQKLRGALRVLIGKGTPEEIVDEAQLLAVKKKIDLDKIDEEAIKRFLIDHNLGVECSGFVYHVLDAELKAKGKGSLKRHLRFPQIRNPIRKLLATFRTTENTNVQVLNSTSNSTEIEIIDVRPGDIITQMNINGESDHVFLVQGIEFEKGKPSVIFYTHANQMPADGKYDHGVRQGSITITDINKPIEKQKWPSDDNTMATWGNNTSLRRLNALR